MLIIKKKEAAANQPISDYYETTSINTWAVKFSLPNRET